MVRCWMLLVCVWACVAGRAWSPEKWFDKAKSPRIANYRIEAVLDWQAKRLEGSLTLAWRNTGTAPTQELPLHLYLNAFKGPQSLFLQEQGAKPSLTDRAAWGYCQLLSVELEGRRLEGHFGEDETVYWVRLGRPVVPGETIQVHITWASLFPKVSARSGWAGDFLMVSQWFPKVGVYQGDRWNCHAYHGQTEFFADFGVYDVVVSMPNLLSLACTGLPVPQTFKNTAGGLEYRDAQPDPKRPNHHLWTLHAEDVHDFAFAVMPQRSWAMDKMRTRGIDVYFFYPPANGTQLERMKRAVSDALKLAHDWYFLYPYPVLTVVDVPEEAREASGMEYPTLFTTTSVAFDPLKQRFAPEGISIHEFGHQFFQGILASNEVEEPWLDEGLTSWFTQKAMARLYHSLIPSRRFHLEAGSVDWMEYWNNPQFDPLTRMGHRAIPGGYTTLAYAKPAMVLSQLEAMLGQPVMEEALRVYAQEWAFRHPTGKDLRKVLERVSGRDLSAFWRDFVEGTEVMDYAIHRVGNEPVFNGGWVETPQGMTFMPPVPVAPGTRSEILVVRKGGIRVPVTLWVRLEDKSEHRLTWDGEDRWARFTFKSPIEAAILDPDGNHPMLKDRLHASWTRKPVKRGVHYWSQLVWGGLCGLLQGVGLG